MFDPLTLVVTQAAGTLPKVHPVVRPILLTVWPTRELARSLLIVNDGLVVLIVSEPVRLPRAVGRPVRPSVCETLVRYLPREESLKRQRRVAGQAPPVKYTGSANSVPIWVLAWKRSCW